MSESDALDVLQSINAQAQFNRWLGIEVLAAESGRAEIGIDWDEKLGQYSGFLHAGVIGALIDTACGFAAATLVGRVMASHYSVNCLSPAVGARFVAVGRVTKAGKRQVFAAGDLFALDQAGKRKLVANGEVLLLTVAQESDPK
jgi:uncharacterized protein (TIGR00369 family)